MPAIAYLKAKTVVMARRAAMKRAMPPGFVAGIKVFDEVPPSEQTRCAKMSLK